MFLPYLKIVHQKEAVIVERLGRFEAVLEAGLHVILPWQNVRGALSLKVQELQVAVETKTRDDVFVKLLIAVQYFVIPERVKEAFYELSNPIQQIESYIFDEVRSTVPRMPLDEVFQNKDEIAGAVKENLQETMTQYGYGIVRALVNDIDPDEKVKAAMNEINAATRLRKAAEERGEAERILKVKQAQGDAEANVLHGEGIAGQRKAIIDGLGESVENFEQAVPGASINDVMQLILMTQYFDMLKEVGASSRGNTILLPHTPGGLAEIMSQVRDSIITGNVAAATHNEATGAPNPTSVPRPTPAPAAPRRPAPMPKPDGAVPPAPMAPPPQRPG